MGIFTQSVTVGCTTAGVPLHLEWNGRDYVLADRSAVIFIAPSDIDRVLVAAETIVAKEAAMAAALRAGTPVAEVMGGNYEHMLQKETP